MENIVYGQLFKEDVAVGFGTVANVVLPDGSSNTLTKLGIQSFLGGPSGSAYVSATDFIGADAGSQIAAAIAALPSGGIVDARGFVGAQTISSNLTLNKPMALWLNPNSTWTLSNATIQITVDGVAIIGDGSGARLSGACATFQRNFGTATMLQISSGSSTHIEGFLLRNLYFNGGGTDGHGIVVDFSDTWYMENVHVYNGGKSNALRILDDCWDNWVSHCSFYVWGSNSAAGVFPTVNLISNGGSNAITDGHWHGVQFGEAGNGNPTIISDSNVLQQVFVDCKFHTTTGTAPYAMPYFIDWFGYRSEWHGCSFQADTASFSVAQVRIHSGPNNIIGCRFTDVNHGSAIAVLGAGQVTVTGTSVTGSTPNGAIMTDGSASGIITVGTNTMEGMTTGYDFTNGNCTVSIGPSNFFSVTNPLKAGAGHTYADYNNGYGTATMGGFSGPPTRDSAVANATLMLGGRTATQAAGYQNIYGTSLFSAGGQINENFTLGTSGLAGFGAVLGTGIEHAIAWGYSADGTIFAVYAKAPATPLSSSNIMFSVLNGNGFLKLKTGILITSGVGSPEGAVTAPVGSTYSRTDGGAGTSFYVKESGSGNTGWVGK